MNVLCFKKWVALLLAEARSLLPKKKFKKWVALVLAEDRSLPPKKLCSSQCCNHELSLPLLWFISCATVVINITLFLCRVSLFSFGWLVCFLARGSFESGVLVLAFGGGEQHWEPFHPSGTGCANCTVSSGTTATETGSGTWFCIKLKGVLFFQFCGVTEQCYI